MSKRSSRRKHHEESHASHPDEKWLVSYADMMTLLFGFFVLMFSLASQHKGDFNVGLQEIVKDLNPKKDEKTEKIVKADKAETVSLIEFKKLEEEKKAALVQIEELKQKLEQFAALSLIQSAAEKNKMDLSKDYDLALQKISELEKLLTDLRARNYMMVFIKWDTEKHDIDMVLKDPSGHVFDFKNRTFSNVSGNLILDSRYGPGVEAWSSSKLVAGNYEITASLYNQFGNINDAIVNGSIMTGYGVVQLPKFSLNMKDHSSQIFKFNVSAEGKVSLK